MTHVDAEADQVSGVEEVVRDGLSQVEGQLDEPEGGAGVGGGEDDPASVVHHRDVCCQYHLPIKIDWRQAWTMSPCFWFSPNKV